jgi:hypothetical protein
MVEFLLYKPPPPPPPKKKSKYNNKKYCSPLSAKSNDGKKGLYMICPCAKSAQENNTVYIEFPLVVNLSLMGHDPK